MTDAQYKECTAKIKAMADIRPIAVDDADSIIRAYHRNLKSGENKPLLDLSAEEQAAFAAKEKELLAAQAAGLAWPGQNSGVAGYLMI
ncbi:hypothetical protein DTO013F2_10628 [Penicillium roqueforti]|nr:hypothetical protein DTO013F2_10628 [Penicillium roqueforti]